MSGGTIVSIAERWRQYRDAVVPKGAGPTQIQECRRAFFGGFWSCLTVMKSLSMLEENEALLMLDTLEAEAQKFKNDVGTPNEPREG